MLTVSTLGKFQIMYKKCIMREEDFNSEDEVKLFLYMMLYHGQKVNESQIGVSLWGVSAFFNDKSVFKVFKGLKESLNKKFPKLTFFTKGEGCSYKWNDEININYDGEQFGYLITGAMHDSDLQGRMEKYERAISLFEGEFMPEYIDTGWILERNIFYHALYISAVRSLADLYCAFEQYDDLEELCHNALIIENTDDVLYGYLIKAYVRRGSISLAMECYEQAKIVMEQKMKIKTSAILDKVYKEFIDINKYSEDAEPLSFTPTPVDQKTAGAFMCSYPIFREMFRLEARESVRHGRKSQVLLLTVEEENDELFLETVEALDEAIREALREGDVATNYSKNQILILLSGCNYEQGMLVANRILSRLYKINEKTRNVTIHVENEAVTDTKILE